MSGSNPAVTPGQIWRSDPADAFFLVTEAGGNYYVHTFEVELHPEHGYWQPAGDGSGRDTPEAWLTTYARPYDRVERWLVDGPRLLSIDPHRYLGLPTKG